MLIILGDQLPPVPERVTAPGYDSPGMLPIAASKSYRYTVHSCALFDFAGYWAGIKGIRPFSKVIRCNSIRVVIDRFVADAHTVCIHSKTLEAGANTRKGQ
jgi:hypothetical protein